MSHEETAYLNRADQELRDRGRRFGRALPATVVGTDEEG
jgi:hypothetical protein